MAAVLAGMRRALRPGGRLVAWDVDWSTARTKPAGGQPSSGNSPPKAFFFFCVQFCFTATRRPSRPGTLPDPTRITAV